MSRALAAFHVDRLAAAGLLDVTYRRLTGRSGPGAGRPAKLYHRADAEFLVALPDRRYESLARLLAAGLREVGGYRAGLRDAARAAGLEVGARVRRAARGRPATTRALRRVLAEEGFEPTEGANGAIRLGNCPFEALAREDPELVCRANLWFMQGALEGAGVPGLIADLAPEPDACCVVFRRGD